MCTWAADVALPKVQKYAKLAHWHLYTWLNLLMASLPAPTSPHSAQQRASLHSSSALTLFSLPLLLSLPSFQACVQQVIFLELSFTAPPNCYI